MAGRRGAPRGVYVPGLLAARKRRLWTQEELARESGVARNTIARLELGDSAALSTVRRLAAALGAEPEALTEDRERPQMAAAA